MLSMVMLQRCTRTFLKLCSGSSFPVPQTASREENRQHSSERRKKMLTSPR